MRTSASRRMFFATCVATLAAAVGSIGRTVSAQGPILQYFESPYAETTDRIPDVFMAGYGTLWIPPSSKAEGGQSVGYDVFDRFQLDGTFYGNGDELKRLIDEAHRAGLRDVGAESAGGCFISAFRNRTGGERDCRRAIERAERRPAPHTCRTADGEHRNHFADLERRESR